MKLKTLLLSAILTALPSYAGTITGNMIVPNGLPVKNGVLTFQLQQAGLAIGSGSVVPIAAQCATSSDGSVVGLPNQQTLPNVVPGGFSNLISGIYYVQTTFYNTSGESLPSPEFKIQTTFNQTLIVSPPKSFPLGATGMKVYIGAAPGSETLQGTTTNSIAQYVQSQNLTTGAVPPTVNSSICTIAFNDTIVPYTGYNVSLLSAQGNAYPGWPQAWQLNGGLTGTVNVSQGAPLWNGVTTYPSPVLMQPLNHGPQSIGGNLDMGGYNITNVGTLGADTLNLNTLNVGVINTTIDVALQPGSDLPEQVTNSLTKCSNQCMLYVQAGNYQFSSTINLPLIPSGSYGITFDPGAIINYQGSGDEILASPSGSIGTSSIIIQGGQHIGNSSALSAVHILPTNGFTIRDMIIKGFTGGDGIRIEGANSGLVTNNTISGSVNGVHLIPTFCSGLNCGQGVTGTPFEANAVKVISNRILNNSHWGIFGETTLVGGNLTGALNDQYIFNDLEQNGTAGASFGAIFEQRSYGTTISGNYLELSPREVVLGVPNVGSGFESFGPVISNNFFTTTSGTPYSVELQNTDSAQIVGNTEQVASSTTANCFLNQFSGTAGVNSYFGINYVQTGKTTAGNTICTAGGASLMSGTGSYRAFPPNSLAQLVSGNWITAATTSEVIGPLNTIPGSYCYATPHDASANTATWAAYSVWVEAQTQQVLLHHPATANVHLDIWCALEQPSS